MAGLVLELQRDALDKNINVSDLLRKALVVSKKLVIVEIETWIRNELYGYSYDQEAIPAYRDIRGEVKVFNPYHGWQSLNVGSSEIEDVLSTRKIAQPVGELDSLANDHKGEFLQIPFDQSTKNELIRLMHVKLEPTLVVPQTEIVGVLEAIRTEVLNWALDLESREILGDGMSFSKEEKQTASQITYQVTNNIENMNNSQLQQDSAGASQSLTVHDNSTKIREFVEKYRQFSDQLEIGDAQRKELETDVSMVELQLDSPKPKPTIINESVKSIRSILEGITGSIIATGLLALL
ncbi:hypothetical protein AB4369_21170 [Vibrio sp. 10N.261.49.A5]|uniref:AbiTii domain-containing protein n=1 Tax=unclassified Vibrio TaxID=2614977 RepID=UPI00354CA9D5